jgi:hypothetical protein
MFIVTLATTCTSSLKGAVSASHLRDGVVRNLPAGVARAGLDPVVVALVGDLQKDLDHGWIGLGDVLALPEMTCGLRI